MKAIKIDSKNKLITAIDLISINFKTLIGDEDYKSVYNWMIRDKDSIAYNHHLYVSKNTKIIDYPSKGIFLVENNSYFVGNAIIFGGKFDEFKDCKYSVDTVKNLINFPSNDEIRKYLETCLSIAKETIDLQESWGKLDSTQEEIKKRAELNILDYEALLRNL